MAIRSSEDQRGVDVGQIRAQLRLPVAERVRVMVEAANVMIVMELHAHDCRGLPSADSRFRSDLSLVLDP